MIKSELEVGAIESKNPVGYIFNLKANHGMSDKAGDTINLNIAGNADQPIKIDVNEAERLKDIARQLAKQDTERE